jgi:hypothetical protein
LFSDAAAYKGSVFRGVKGVVGTFIGLTTTVRPQVSLSETA